MTLDLHRGSGCLQHSGERQATCFGLSPKPHTCRHIAHYKELAQTDSVAPLPIHLVIAVYGTPGEGER